MIQQMGWTWFVGLFAFASGASLWAARRTLSLYDVEIRRPLVVFFGLTAAWAVSNAFLVVPVSARLMHVSYLLGLIVGISAVVAWLWFCSAYAGTPYHYSRRVRALVLGTLGVVVAIKLTNPLHELYFRPTVASEPFRHFAPEPGLLYWLVTAIAYVGAAIGLYLLFDTYSSSRFETANVAVLTALVGLPVVPKLLAVLFPGTLLLVFYEPLGVAIFGIGVLTVARDTFLSVRAPARRQLADRLSEVVVVVDNRDRIADYNRSAERLLGPLDGRLGERLETALPRLAAHDDADRLLELRDGTRTRYYVVRTPPIELGDNTIGRAFVLSDVTELEAQRRKLERQSEHLDAVTDEMAHQLRNPLTALKGNLELLRSDRPSADRRDGTAPDAPVDAALTATDRIEAIAENLISVVNYGKPVSETEALVLGDVVGTAIEGDGGVDVAVRFDCAESTRLRAERVRCSELFRLIFRIHRRRGAREVSIRRSGSRLTIGSDGEPFSTDSPEKLFEYGIETDDDERVQLAHARTLAQVHGWSIRAAVDRDTPAILLDGITFLSGEA